MFAVPSTIVATAQSAASEGSFLVSGGYFRVLLETSQAGRSVYVVTKIVSEYSKVVSSEITGRTFVTSIKFS